MWINTAADFSHKNIVLKMFSFFFFNGNDRSKAVLLPWFIFVIVRLWMCVSLTYIILDSHLATLWESNCPFGFLLVMFPLGSSYFVFVFLSLWCLWWDVWDDCIGSWSLPFLLFYIFYNTKVNIKIVSWPNMWIPDHKFRWNMVI